MVAVKIIEHSADENSKIESFRENLVSSNLQHPNVLITYKASACYKALSASQSCYIQAQSYARHFCDSVPLLSKTHFQPGG